MGYDQAISIFSPEGRLYQVQYSHKTLATESLTNIGIRGKDCAVVIAQKKVPDKLLRPEHITHIHTVTKEIGVAVCGRVPDCLSVVDDARRLASEFPENNGFPCPPTWLAKRLASRAHVYTQHAGYRPMGCGSIFCAMEQEDNGEVLPKIITVGPDGMYFGFKATALGQKASEVKINLEKMYKEDLPLGEAIMVGIGSLQKCLGNNDNNLTAADLEVAIVTKDNPKFRRVSDAEVEEYITKIVERQFD